MANTVLGRIFVSKLKGCSESVHSKILESIAEYIEKNVTISGTFTGNLISSPFSLGVFPVNHKITCSDLSTSSLSFPKVSNTEKGVSQWKTWMTNIYNLIKTKSSVIPNNNIPVSMVLSFPTLITPTWSQSDLSGVEDNKGSIDKIFDIMAGKIIKDLKENYIKSFPSNYSSSYLGNTAITLINCP